MGRPSKVVLITGCSSGIGWALCEAFHRRGQRVVATARRLESLEGLKVQGMVTERLDVTHSDDIERVVGAVLEREGRIDMLVNNAGYGLIGPLLDLSETALLEQFRTNGFAPLVLVRRVAPSMRAAGGGTIVNIGSISGVAVTPFAGAYCASKASLHALSDVLRMELAPFGIRVILVQPGAVRSAFGGSAADLAFGLLRPDSWYRALTKNIMTRANLSQLDATPTPELAHRLVSLLLSERPPAVIRLGKKSTWLPLMKSLLPVRFYDRIMKERFGLSSLDREVD